MADKKNALQMAQGKREMYAILIFPVSTIIFPEIQAKANDKKKSVFCFKQSGNDRSMSHQSCPK